MSGILPKEIIQIILNFTPGVTAFNLVNSCKYLSDLRPKYDDDYKMFNVFTCIDLDVIEITKHGHLTNSKMISDTVWGAVLGGHAWILDKFNFSDSDALIYIETLIKHKHIDAAWHLSNKYKIGRNELGAQILNSFNEEKIKNLFTCTHINVFASVYISDRFDILVKYPSYNQCLGHVLYNDPPYFNIDTLDTSHKDAFVRAAVMHNRIDLLPIIIYYPCLVGYIVRYNNIEMLKVMLDKPNISNTNILWYAYDSRNLELINLIHTKISPDYTLMLQKSISNNNLNLFTHAYKHSYIDRIVYINNDDAMAMQIKSGKKYDEPVISFLCTKGLLNSLKLIDHPSILKNISKYLGLVMFNRRRRVYKYLLENFKTDNIQLDQTQY